jgi:uroporphyrinogen decarboxylase
MLGVDEGPATGGGGLGVDFRMIPQFDEEVLEHRDGHYVVRDWKGNVCEISDEYDPTYLRCAKDFVTRRWISCPVESRADWESMKQRYRLDSPGRFPADFDSRCERARRREGVLTAAFPGPFWQMREWCGFEGLCELMALEPEFVDEMAAFWAGFVDGVLERVLERIVPDAIHVSEDMACKERAMISPAMTRRFCMPAWRLWAGRARSAGVPVVDMDSDGFVGELVPLWLESGFNVCDPVEVAAGNDIVGLRREHGGRMAFRGGIDKRAIAKGGEAIRKEVARVTPVVEDGGYIPSCDHGVPADVSWPAFVDYSRLLAEVTRWL